MVCVAFQTWSQQVLARTLADGAERVLARLFGPGTWWAKPSGMQPWWKGQTRERGAVCSWKVCSHVRMAPVWVEMYAQRVTTERGGSWPPGESLHKTYEKALAMPMAAPATWKKISFLSGVNLDKLPTSQFLCSLGCKEVVTHDLLPKVTARIAWINTCNVLRA